MTLDHLLPNQTATILYIHGKGVLRKRLLEMGLTPQTQITVRKIAPMGDPIEVYLRHYTLTLRKKDASQIIVEEV